MTRFLFILSIAVVWAPHALRAQPTPPPEETPPPEGTPANPEGMPAGPPAGSPASPAQPTVTDPVPPAVTPEVAAKPSPRASDFMDVRLSFTCTHEDVLREKDVFPSAPGFHCGRPNVLGILFFDNYDTRFSGFETLAHLALYRKFDGSRTLSPADDHWDVEGGLIIRINELAEDVISLADGGSYIRAAYYPDATRANRSSISFVAFPVSSDRMRLGYSYRISWGGSPEFFKRNPDIPGSIGRNREAVPGFKIQYDGESAYAYAGLKSTLLRDPEDNELRAVLAGLFGGGVDVNDLIRIDLNGGVFDRGKNELEDVIDERVILYGLSAQVVLHQGMPVGSSIDYKLYRNDPESIARLFRPEEYPGGVSWLVSAEATTLAQTLKDPAAAGSTTTQRGFAGDVNVRVKAGKTRFRLDVMMRDLAYILHSTPSLPSYSDFPVDDEMTMDIDEGYATTPEIFASAGVDHFFPATGLTLGATFGLDIPATLRTPRPSDIEGNQSNSATLVVKSENQFSVLPVGEEVAPVMALKASARLDFAESFAAFGDVYFQYDPNTVKYSRDNPEGAFVPVFANFNQLGFSFTLQARF